MDDFEDGDRIRELPCGHVFHAECVDEWLRVHPSCPVCRMDVGEALVETTTTAAAAAEGRRGSSHAWSAVPPVRVALAGDEGEGSCGSKCRRGCRRVEETARGGLQSKQRGYPRCLHMIKIESKCLLRHVC